VLDDRLLSPDPAPGVLADVFTAHRPAPLQTACPACKHQATASEPECPSAAVARHLLKRAVRNRGYAALAPVVPDEVLTAVECGPLPAHGHPVPPATPDHHQGSLFGCDEMPAAVRASRSAHGRWQP
jgi:hypothetical protein